VVANRLAIAAPHPERHAPFDLIRDPLVVLGCEIGCAERRPHREVAARDVVADARRRDVVAIADHAADRHRVAEMSVGAEHRRCAGLRGGAALQLLDGRRVVPPENLDHGDHAAETRVAAYMERG